MASVVGVLGSVVKGALVTVGVLALLVVLGLWWLFSGSGKKPVSEPVEITVPAAVGVKGASCACYSGAELCTGPQGGKYCISEDGKKRYK